ARFLVAAARHPSAPPSAAEQGPKAEPALAAAWLMDLPEGGVRQLFQHLAVHGTVTDTEAAAMLGSPRAARRFASRFAQLADKAPFSVRIDMVAVVKRYVREGSGQRQPPWAGEMGPWARREIAWVFDLGPWAAFLGAQPGSFHGFKIGALVARCPGGVRSASWCGGLLWSWGVLVWCLAGVATSNAVMLRRVRAVPWE